MPTRIVLDMTNSNCKFGVAMLSKDKGLYEVDIDDAWFELPPGEFRDAVLAHPSYTLCVYHRKTEAHLYHHMDQNASNHKGHIVIKPGGYARWKKTHADIVAWKFT